MVGTRIKIVWEEQLVDPPNEYIKEERHNKDDHIDRTVLKLVHHFINGIYKCRPNAIWLPNFLPFE